MTSAHDFWLSDSDRQLHDQIMKDRIAEEPHMFDLSVEIEPTVSLNKKIRAKKRKLANASSSAPDSVSGQDLTCEMCNKTYKQIKFLISHILDTHILKNNQVCLTCNKTFKTDLLYRIHLSAHTPEENLCCPFCDETFTNKIYLLKHAQCHKIASHCNICFTNIPCPLDFRKHMQEHISDTNYKCQICHKTMRHETDMQFHVNRHVYKNVYPSRVNKIKNQKVKYHSHQQITKGYKCQDCNISCMRKNLLEMHFLKHPSHKLQVSNLHQHSEIIEIDGDDDDQNQNNNSKTIETHTIIDDDIQEIDTQVSTIPENCVKIHSNENQTNGNQTDDSQNKILASMLNNEENEVENNSNSNVLFKNVSSPQANCLQESINNECIENIISEKQCEDTVHITEKPVVISKKVMPEISNSNEEICEVKNNDKKCLELEINAEEIRDAKNNGEKVQEVENNEEPIEKIDDIYEKIAEIENCVENTLEI